MIDSNSEGFVIRFKSGMRLKIKGEEYVRLHRILTGFSNINIWDYLKSGKDFNDFLEKVPDEFDLWVKETVRDLVIRHENIEKEYKSIYHDILCRIDKDDRKAFAESAKQYNHSSILFKMLDGKDYSDYLWKIVRPKFSKPFWQKEEE